MPSKTHVCPVNGQKYMQVSIRTMLHHISSPWEWTEKEQGYYFCDDPTCGVVYFGEDDSVIKKADTRTVVGIKEDKPDALTCYCFGVSNLEAQRHPDIRDFFWTLLPKGFPGRSKIQSLRSDFISHE
jgi:hypothetical protein